jgi:hypothetical protein
MGHVVIGFLTTRASIVEAVGNEGISKIVIGSVGVEEFARLRGFGKAKRKSEE